MQSVTLQVSESLSDDVDDAADRLGLSRICVIRQAIQEYLGGRSERRKATRQATAKLDVDWLQVRRQLQSSRCPLDCCPVEGVPPHECPHDACPHGGCPAWFCQL